MNLKYIRQLIFGQDIFISHRWTDSSKNYALKLAEELEKRGLDCFIDYNEIHAGDSIPALIQLAIKRSRMFLLITHKDVLGSTWIPKEIKLADNGRRKIIPLNIANMIEGFDLTADEWKPLYNRDRIEETLESFEAATPSADVLTEIDQSFTARRNKAKATQALFIAAVVILLFTIIPATYALYVRKQAEIETGELKQQAQTANTALDVAKGDLETVKEEQLKTQNSLTQLTTDLSNKTRELETRNTELETAKTELGDTKNKLGNAKSDLGKAKSDLNNKQTELNSVQITLQDKQKQLSKAETDLINFRGIEPPIIIPYNPNFLGKVSVPLPTITNETVKGDRLNGKVFDYTHFSLVMDESRAMPLYTACNIDGGKLYRIKREKDSWLLDSRIDRDLQKGGGVYNGNDFDRGHLVRRTEVAWGDTEEEAKSAALATFFYSNAAPQYGSFNQRIWYQLEDYYFNLSAINRSRLTVFTGPVSQSTDIDYRGSRIPQAFWKIIAFVDPANDSKLLVYAYLIKQYEIGENGKPIQVSAVKLVPNDSVDNQSDESDVSGTSIFPVKFDHKAYKVSVSQIEKYSSLDFGLLKQFDTFQKN